MVMAKQKETKKMSAALETHTTEPGRALRLPVKQIFADPERNARTLPSNIEEMARDILAHGLLQPIVVVTGDSAMAKIGCSHFVTAGFRRLAAFNHIPGMVAKDRADALDAAKKRAAETGKAFDTTEWEKKNPPIDVSRFDEIECMLLEGTAQEIEAANLRENLHRVPMHWTDEASKYAKMRAAYDASTKDIEALVGKSDKHIANMLRAKDQLIPEIWEKARLDDGGIGVKLAIDLCKLTPEEQAKWLADAQSGGGTGGSGKGGKRGASTRPSAKALIEMIDGLKKGSHDGKHGPEWIKGAMVALAYASGTGEFPKGKAVGAVPPANAPAGKGKKRGAKSNG